MKIEKIDHNQLKVTLSCTEMLQMNLEIDPKEPQNILTKLLYALETDYQFSMMNHKIMLEMIPSKQDGCNIFITKTESKQKQTNPADSLLIFSFMQWKTVDYIKQLIGNQLPEEHQIYRLDGLYYLLLHPFSFEQEEQIKMLLSDFGECIENPKLFESVLKEYATPLLPNDSLVNQLPKKIK